MKKRTVSICIIATLFMFSLILVIGAPNGRIKEVAALSTPTFILVSNATTVYATEFIRLTGTLSIPKTGTVILQWAINSSGLIYTKNEPITDGVFARDFGFSAGTGIWQLRVNWTGDATSNPATSTRSQ